MKLGREEEEGTFWTWDGVQERLVETVRCWWRMPGEGRWPFAGDGPWHLARRENTPLDAAEMELIRAQMAEEARLRTLPLRRAEIAAMMEATEWITWVPEAKRVPLVFGIAKLAGGARQIPWSKLQRRLHTVGTGGLEWRYSSGIELIANVLNAMSGVPYAPKGVRVRYPKAVRNMVERLKMAENRAGNQSSPVMVQR
jgi:hypothetical protein